MTGISPSTLRYAGSSGGVTPPRLGMRPLHTHPPMTLPLLLMASAVAHLFAIWGLLFHPMFQATPPQKAPIIVRLVELPAGEGGRLDVAPGGRTPTPRVVEPAKPKDPPKATLPGKAPTEVSGQSPVKDPKREGGAAGLGKGGPAGLGGKSPGLLLDEPSFQYEWYKARLEDALRSRWRKPLLQDRVTATVHFVILATGGASEIQIVQSSGQPDFDQSVIRAVYDAAPFPKFPPQYTSNQLGVLYTFELIPDK